MMGDVATSWYRNVDTGVQFHVADGTAAHKRILAERRADGSPQFVDIKEQRTEPKPPRDPVFSRDQLAAMARMQASANAQLAAAAAAEQARLAQEAADTEAADAEAAKLEAEKQSAAEAAKNQKAGS